ncbi:MAG: proline--tRNA ligase [Clostridiales Family XIII bacterium]|jgi:prolyl-tRNA synthetase|nr:proline--tRNA ligase [Clostridiales Family XIII bacterium]
MRLSQAHVNTLREAPKEAEIPSHIWLLRSGMIRKMVSGVYGYMNMGWRTVRKIEQIVREEMDATGAMEILMSPLQSADLWRESGRWSVFGPEMWRVRDRHAREFCLGPTAEEVFTDIARSEITSHKQLPVNLYQIQTKYRDEARPRYGLMRAREFIMKDAYSFDRDYEGLSESYRIMFDAYTRIFTRCGLDFRAVYADSGAIGGNESQEFVALCEYGESDVVYCAACGFAATADQAEFKDAAASVSDEPLDALTEVHTPGTKTIEAVADFLGVTKDKTIKALMFVVYEDSEEIGRVSGDSDDSVEDGGSGENGGSGSAGDSLSAGYEVSEYVCAFIRGDRELNMTKLTNALGVAEHLIAFADESAMGEATGCVGGFTGPTRLHDCKLVVDSELVGQKNLVAGACRTDYHLTGVNYGRDYVGDIVADLKLVREGDPCPVCGTAVKSARGIEVGQVFKLGTKYSEAMKATYRDENMEEQLIVMGCYGIGVTRTMAAVVEQSHDDKGIIWPMSVAPYHVIVTLAKPDDADALKMAEDVYEGLLGEGVEAVLDDREERAGVKFNDADIFGIPIRITVGRKYADGIVEYKLRRESEASEMSPAEAVALAAKTVRAEIRGI